MRIAENCVLFLTVYIYYGRTCETGYGMSDGICKKCTVEHCDVCSSDSPDADCSHCSKGFHYNKEYKECIECPTNCEYCPSQELCTKCYNPYYWDSTSTTCIPCSKKGSKFEHCSMCTAYDLFCRVCNDGYTAYEGDCVTDSPCGEGCHICKGGKCTVCEIHNGYYLNGDQCAKCRDLHGDFCLNCNQTNCWTCGEGYMIDLSTEKCIVQSIANCWFSWNKSTCLKCEPVEVRTIDGVCSSPVPKCKEYHGDGTCHTCGENTMGEIGIEDIYRYHMDSPESEISDFAISACVSSCKGNSFYYNDVYSFQKDFCISGNECPMGWYAYSNAACYKCPGDCEECILSNGDVECRQCAPGTAYNESSGECVPCMEGCEVCGDTPYICMRCADNYYKSGDSRCFPCSDNCLQCTSPTACYICHPGYIHIGGACVSCPPHCLSCLQSDLCSECTLDRYLTPSGTCQYCEGRRCFQCLGDKCGGCTYPYNLLMVAQDDYIPHLPPFGDDCTNWCDQHAYYFDGGATGQKMCLIGGWCPHGYLHNGHFVCVPAAIYQ